MSKKTKLPFDIQADERGSVLPMFALMSTIAIGAVGGSVDFGRAYQQRSKMQNALDGSITSGLRTYQLTNDWSKAQQLAQDLFAAQFANYLVKDPSGVIYDPRDPRNTDPNNPNYAPNKIEVTPSADQPVLQYTFQPSGSTFDGTATMTVTTPFWQLVTGSPLSVGASSNADLNGASTSTPTKTRVEVSMMVDLTGSMGQTVPTSPTNSTQVTKISALSSVGQSLISTLFNGDNANYVKVGIAPFADYVNAGEYAAQVTGNTGAAATGNYGSNADLSKTGNGPFNGSYSGVTGNSTGSHSGATPHGGTSGSSPASSSLANSATAFTSGAVAASLGSATTSGGGTFQSGWCSGTTTSYTQSGTWTSNLKKDASNNDYGVTFSSFSVSGTSDAVLKKMGIYKVESGKSVRKINSGAYSNSTTISWSGQPLESTANTYYLALPSSVSGLSRVDKESYGDEIGVVVTVTGVPSWFDSDDKRSLARSMGLEYDSVYPITGVSNNRFTIGSRQDNKFFVPVYSNSSYDNNDTINYSNNTAYGVMGTASTVVYAGCQTLAQAQAGQTIGTGADSATTTATVPTGPLITCVTERRDTTGKLDYTDDAPTTKFIGSYNHGVTSKSNYSSDGKCNVAGRELPKVIPLTNDSTTLSSFFYGSSGNGPKIGGGTPGHLGTAWAWYLLSPSWSSVWGGAKTGANYNDTGTKKYAILMTDGEYNMYYYSNDGTGTAASSQNQALALCTAMKAKGITIITIGFGYSDSLTKQPSNASGATAQQKAMYTLQQCASPTPSGSTKNNYYFPYYSSELSSVFTSIGETVNGTVNASVVVQGARITN